MIKPALICMKTMPLVSIITPALNSATTIAHTLQSVAEQEYPRIQHIIVDGGSRDQTVEIVKQFSHVAHLVSEPDLGIYSAMNKGILLAEGEIIGILNSDDFYANKAVISKVVEYFEASSAETLYGDLDFVHPKNINQIVRVWRSGRFKSHLFLFGWMPPHPTFFVRRNVYKRYGLFDINLRFSADYEFMLRLLYKWRVSTTYLPEVLVKMRAGGQSNTSLRIRLKANKEDQIAWKINALKPYFFTHWLKPLRKVPQFFRKG